MVAMDSAIYDFRILAMMSVSIFNGIWNCVMHSSTSAVFVFEKQTGHESLWNHYLGKGHAGSIHSTFVKQVVLIENEYGS